MAQDETITVESTPDSLTIRFPTTFRPDYPFKNWGVLGRLLRLLIIGGWMALMAWAAWGIAQDVPANFAHFAALGWRGAWLYVWVGGGLVALMTLGVAFGTWGLILTMTGAQTRVYANRNEIVASEWHGPVRRRRVCGWRDITGLSLIMQNRQGRASAQGPPLYALVAALRDRRRVVIGGDLSRAMALDAGRALVDWSREHADVPLAGLLDTEDESTLNRERPSPPPGCSVSVLPDGSQRLCFYSGGVPLGKFVRKPAMLVVWAVSVWVAVALWLASGLPLQPVLSSSVGIVVMAALCGLLVGALYYGQRRPRAITLTPGEIRAAQGVRVPRSEVRAIRIGRRGDTAQPVLYAMLTGYRPRTLDKDDLHTMQWAASQLREILGVPVLAEGGDRDDPLDPRWPSTEWEWAPDGASFRTLTDGEGLQFERETESEHLGCLVTMGAGSLLAGLGCISGAVLAHDAGKRDGYWVLAVIALGFAGLMAFGVFADRKRRERLTVGPESLTRQTIRGSGARSHSWRWSEVEDARAVAELQAFNRIQTRVVVRLRAGSAETLAEVKDPAEALYMATMVRRAWREAAGGDAAPEASHQ